MEEQHTLSVVPSYLAFFNRHLEQFQVHLSGIFQKNECSHSIIGGILWTSQEKDSFFHALSTYSRFRPDLIATCIGTKNEVEVLEYLTILHDNCRTGNSRRDLLPIAHEVSDAWLEWEEENAERLTLNEEHWSRLSEDKTNTTDNVEDSHEQNVFLDTDKIGGVKQLSYGHLHVLSSILNQQDDNVGPKVAESSTYEHSPLIDNVVHSAPMAELGSHIDTEEAEEKEQVGLDTSSTLPEAGPAEEGLSIPPPDLSPLSRRRYRKRLYMRQKRARLKGEEADISLNKLKSGPKRKKPKLETIIISPSEKIADASSGKKIGPEATAALGTDDSSSGDDDTLVPNTRQRTNFEGIRSQFGQHGILSGTLETRGLDLLNYLKMGKMLRHIVAGYDPEAPAEEASISVETLHFLSEITKDFLIQVMARVIILEEQHRRLRGSTRVWRKTIDESGNPIVNANAIQFALKTMGITTENKDQYFAGLLGEDPEPMLDVQVGYEDNERLSATTNSLYQHPLLQDVCPPLTLLTQNHPLTSNVIDNTLMDIIDDEEAIGMELKEEEALDEMDRLADGRHQRTLWKEIPWSRRR